MSTDKEANGWFLSGPELLAIRQREYHYNAWSDTLLDPYLQPFWRLVVSYVPTYITPSTLSVCGLLCNVLATSVTLTFAPGLTEALPSWVSILNAVSVFFYQTFDGIDGKQCFRTQNSELEEYADHAVDSISLMLNAIVLAAAMQLGDSHLLLSMNFTLALSAFYIAHWAAKRTHSLVFGHIDVSEAQWSMIAIHVATAIGGPTLWNMFIHENLKVTVREVVCIASAATLLYGTLGNAMIVLGLKKTPLESHGIQIPRQPLSLRPLVPYSIIVLSFMLCIRSGLLAHVTVPVMLIVGLALGKAATGLILQKLTTREGSSLDASMLFPLGTVVLQLYSGDDMGLSKIGAWTLVLVLATIVLVFHMHATSDLKKAREIGVFTMRKGPEEVYPKDTGFYVCGGNLQTVQKAWQEFAMNEKRVRETYLSSTPIKRQSRSAVMITDD